ncbi:hypothetical protein Nepgr_027503 [Nepenthes gracilis]|uniref:Methyltransferase type 11 domain-containing protein n=1 Tax=Nepenthes gracilis TaxID=150966 RepID=A0AAD3T9Z3_NEPGR|nr:hypothetical protein Nepgr_027503 [Nepenthes gracilis]
MGSDGEDQYPREQPPHQQAPTQYSKLKLLLLVILTNLLTIFFLTAPNLSSHAAKHLNLPLREEFATSLLLLLRQLNATRGHLVASQSRVSTLHKKLTSANLLVRSLLIQLNDSSSNSSRATELDKFNGVLTGRSSSELGLVLGAHKLPLGHSPRTGTDEVYQPVGAGNCLLYKDELVQFMSYDVEGECPVDDVFSQRLMLKGCEPLPRRRCHPKSPAGYVEPAPLPKSLWAMPPDTSIIWDPYSCKNYKCQMDREKAPGFYDCKDCFNLHGREKTRWLSDTGGLDYGVDQVLGMKPPGTIRIGLDIGGGSGTFAARMRERNITIVTTTMNLDGPFNSFIASRGLVPLHVSVSQRLPLFENTMDMVHSMHVLSNWIPDAMLEFTLYDIYRVLRPGGLFWLDHFFCRGLQLNQTYAPMIDRIGFKKLRSNVGMKLDRGLQEREWYFSALFEKPMN